jgi:uncharacterized membrane protein
MSAPLLAALARSGVCATHRRAYNRWMEKKIFWMIFAVLGLVADFLLPFWWAVAATIPILILSWWIVYRSDWF